MKTAFVNGARINDIALAIIALKGNLTATGQYVIESEGIIVENASNPDEKIVHNGVIMISAAQGEQLAKEHGVPSFAILANAVRQGNTLSTVTVNLEICLKDGNILDDKGNPIVGANGKSKYEKTWLKLADRKDGISIELGKDQTAYITRLNETVDIEAIKAAREQENTVVMEAKATARSKRKDWNAKNTATPVTPVTGTVVPDASNLFTPPTA